MRERDRKKERAIQWGREVQRETEGGKDKKKRQVEAGGGRQGKEKKKKRGRETKIRNIVSNMNASKTCTTSKRNACQMPYK